MKPAGDRDDQKTTSVLFGFARFSTALAFGAMVGSLFAIRPIPNGLTFQITAGAVIAFLLSATLAWFYWRLIERMASGAAPEQRRKRFALASLGLGVVGVVSFLYPLKFVPEAKRADVFIGLFLAITVISGVGYAMWHVKKFLDADQKDTEDEER